MSKGTRKYLRITLLFEHVFFFRIIRFARFRAVNRMSEFEKEFIGWKVGADDDRVGERSYRAI